MRDAKLKKPVDRSKTKNQPKKFVQVDSSVKTISEKLKRKQIDAPICEKTLKSKRKCCEQKYKKITDFDDVGSDEDGFIEIGDRSEPPKRHDPSK